MISARDERRSVAALTLGALGRPSARAAALPQPLPQPQWATASASGSLQGPGAAANDERHTPSTRASDSDWLRHLPKRGPFLPAPLPHHRPLYLRARRPRAPRIHRRRQRGDGMQFNAVSPLIRILIEEDDRRRSAR